MSPFFSFPPHSFFSLYEAKNLLRIFAYFGTFYFLSNHDLPLLQAKKASFIAPYFAIFRHLKSLIFGFGMLKFKHR
ncbi:MAG: hypothetical protein WC873_00445 [Candidatus Gracilibacteria bacterium]